MSRARRAVLAAVLLAACGGGGGEAPDAAIFAGTWDVQLVVGAVVADPEAPVADQRGDTYRETWVFEGCGQESCRLRRPEGGPALGDLDGAEFRFVDSGSIDDTPRFTAVSVASAVPRVEPEPPPGEEDEHGHDEGEEACYGSPAYRWEVTVEVDVREGVLSGTVLRIPDQLVAEVDGTTCFGTDLTFGLSGVPAG